MALPKGVRSPVDYTKLYMSQVLEGETISEKALSKKQQRFFGIVRAIQKGEQEPTTPETAKAAADMKKSDVKKYASTKHKKLPEKIEEKLDKDDKPFVKKLVGKLRKGSKTHAKQADDLEKAMNEGLGATGPKTAPSSEDMKKKQFAKEPLTQQSLDARKTSQANVTGKMNQLGGITKTTPQNGKLDSMSIQGVGAGTNKDALAAMLPKSGTGLKMDADGNLPNVGAAVQQKAEQGIKIGKGIMQNTGAKFTSSAQKDFNTGTNYVKSGQLAKDVNRQIPGTQQFRYDIAADEINLASQKNKPKNNNRVKVGVSEDIVDENVMLTYKSGQGFDAKIGNRSVRNTVSNIKTGVDAVKNIKKEGGLVSGIKKTINDKKNTNTKTDVSTNVSDAIKNFKMKENTAIESELVIQDWNKDDIKFTEIETVDIIKAKPLKESMTDDEFRETEALMTRNALTGGKLLKNKKQGEKFQNKYATELSRRATTDGPYTYSVDRGNKPKIPVTSKTVAKNFPNLKDHYDWRKDLGEDWQKVNRKDKTDGLSKKAVKAYRRENPGSKLQTAVTKDPKKLKKGSKSAKRRLSFCRRMKGMKKKLTSAKTARDPDSRINKALRRWNC